MSNSAITQQVQGLATTTSPGLVGTGTQSFAGVKTFQDGLVPPSSMMFRNKLINGGFDIWQRGTSQTSNGYGSDDRWSNENLGSTKTASRQTFTLGQTDVPNNPKYWARTVVASVAGAGNYCSKIQRIESVYTLAGQTATLSFWAKADASKNMAVELVQWFGTGGSPSSAVTGLGVTTCALTTSWQRFTVTVTLPSISGKVLGSGNDDHLALIFWMDAGSSFNARTNSLGQQSGTFDIANVQLEAGSAPTPFESRPIGTELALCQRYYEALPYQFVASIFDPSPRSFRFSMYWKQAKRKVLVSGDVTISVGYIAGFGTPIFQAASTDFIALQGSFPTSSANNEINITVIANAEL